MTNLNTKMIEKEMAKVVKYLQLVDYCVIQRVIYPYSIFRGNK